MIAMAIACEPKLLIADEPTTALDVTIQRQILELLAAAARRQHRMSMLFISHDLGVVGEIADQVVVMRHGEVREQGAGRRSIFGAPRTPTRAPCWPAGRRLDAPPPARLPVIDEHHAPGDAAGAPRSACRQGPDAPVVLEVRALAKAFRLRRACSRKREFQAVQRRELRRCDAATRWAWSASRARARPRWA